MIVFEDIESRLSEFAISGSKVAGAIAKLSPYLYAMSAGVQNDGTPLTIATMLTLAATATEGGLSLISTIGKSAAKSNGKNFDKFEVLYHLACQISYTQALNKVLPRLKAKVRQTQIQSNSDLKANKAYEIPTEWNYDLSFDTAKIPLFDDLNESLSNHLTSTGLGEKLVLETVAAVDTAARAFLLQAISDTKGQFSWMGNYVQLESLTKIRAAADSLPENIRNAIVEAAGTFFSTKEDQRSKAAWDEYREYIKTLVEGDIFGSAIGISDIYVMPKFTYYRQSRSSLNSGTIKDVPEMRDNITAFLTQLISQRKPEASMVFIFGEPGVGKTSFAKIYAHALASIPYMHPVYIPLQHINPTLDLIDEFERFLRETPLRDAVKDLHKKANLIFILDGFDELAQATRDSMGDFFRRLERFTSDQLYRNSSVIATGRDTLFNKGDALIPPGCHIITLQLFQKEQIAEWSKKWNKLTKQKFDGTRFWSETESGGLHELASQPLLLYLLAKLEESGSPIDPRLSTSRSAVYRHLVHFVCSRENDKHLKDSLSVSHMRQLLRIVGFLMMSKNKREIHISDLEASVKETDISLSAVQNRESYLAERTFLSFSFNKTGQAAWEFKHKQFGEYLAAEYIAERLSTAVDRTQNLDEPSKTEYVVNHGVITSTWISLFSLNPITPEVQDFLSPMLGVWKEFCSSKVLQASDYEKILIVLLERCGHIFSRLSRELDIAAITTTGGVNVTTTQGLANCYYSLFSIATMCVGASTEKLRFDVDHYRPYGWWKAFLLIRAYFDLNTNVAQRIFSGLLLTHNLYNAVKTPFYPGLFLPFIHVGNEFFKTNDSLNYVLNGALFYYCSMPNVDLTRCSLVGSNCAYATFNEAKLNKVNFTGANLHNVSFQKADLSDAKFCYAIADGSDFSGADLRNADFTGARLINANFINAKLDGAVWEGATLIGANGLTKDILNKQKVLKGSERIRVNIVTRQLKSKTDN